MSDADFFWQEKSLAEMSVSEWESLCDGCGKCCLHKLEDEDTGEVHYTAVACRLLDLGTCRCSHYTERLEQVPGCVHLQPQDVAEFGWLPASCAYRLVAEGKPLPTWHHLISGDEASVHRAQQSVQHRVLAEDAVAEEDLQEYIIQWVD